MRGAGAVVIYIRNNEKSERREFNDKINCAFLGCGEIRTGGDEEGGEEEKEAKVRQRSCWCFHCVLCFVCGVCVCKVCWDGRGGVV